MCSGSSSGACSATIGWLPHPWAENQQADKTNGYTRYTVIQRFFVVSTCDLITTSILLYINTSAQASAVIPILKSVDIWCMFMKNSHICRTSTTPGSVYS